MYFDEYGDKSKQTIVMIHGMNFVHTFVKQYVLSDRYHIVIPHITGYGNEAGTIFTTDKAVAEIIDIISKQNEKVILIGFSLGAQLGFRIVTEIPELIKGAILVSPWLIKDKNSIQFITEMNEKPFHLQQKYKWISKIFGMVNGLSTVQSKEYAKQMQEVQLETIRNSVDNGIELTAYPKFKEISIPILSIVGEKEQDVMKQSVKQMAASNPNCKCEIWNKAAHNIPSLFAKSFNEKIVEFVKDVG